MPKPTSPTPSVPQPRRRRAPDSVRGRVKAHDPFELIRWLALSQPDPRKALAELVQNSLDAEARSIRIIRLREKGIPSLKIVDDGTGVIPELDRKKALEYIATHIGHSRKRALSPQERLTLMTQGQYGIGLLGFWSLGHRLEIRSSVPGQRAHRLVLHRDDPHFEVEPLRGRLALDERWTEVVVIGLHREAANVLVGRRAADYLAAELRGQLLGREVDLVVEDRMARGLAQKVIPVRPPRFLGERIPGLESVDVPGYPPIRIEVYFTNAEESGVQPAGLALYSAGTLVADSFQQLGALGLDRGPWTDARLTGFVDFPGFHVAPGSRRGVMVDEAGSAFARALEPIESILVRLLETLEQRKVEKLDRTIVRDLQRAFRDFYRQRPRYSLLPVHGAKDQPSGPGDEGRSASGRGVVSTEAAAMAESTSEDSRSDGEVEDVASLLPPGPLASLRAIPARVRVECGATKTLRVLALDTMGRPIDAAVQFEWVLEGSVGNLLPEMGEGYAAERLETTGVRGRGAILLQAAADPASGMLQITARSEDRSVSVRVPVEVLEEIANARPAEGIPEPEFVSQPGAAWRSRMQDGHWEVNSGHADFTAVAERPPLKLRYLAMLFAKEIVLRSHQDPRFDQPLEQLVEVAVFADLNLAARNRSLKRPSSAMSPESNS